MTISCIASGPRSDSSPVPAVPRLRLPKGSRKRSLHPKLGPAEQWSVVHSRLEPEAGPDVHAVATTPERVAFSLVCPVLGWAVGRPSGPDAQNLLPLAPELQVEVGSTSNRSPID